MCLPLSSGVTMEPPSSKIMRNCSVLVRKLTLEEISRITLNPFLIGSRCGRCQNYAYYSPKCTTCSVSYHYTCALRRVMCCELPILLVQRTSSHNMRCLKCKKEVEFGPSCKVCHAMYHNYCLNPFDQCCDTILSQLSTRRECRKCHTPMTYGPRCPFCSSTYHAKCAKQGLECCGEKIIFDEDYTRFKCRRCRKILAKGCPMCRVCGKLFHNSCIEPGDVCCGVPINGDICFIPSFQFTLEYFKRVDNKRMKRKSPCDNTYDLRRVVTRIERKKMSRKSVGAQTNGLDSVKIVAVKSEVEDEEEIENSPPVLEKEINYLPEPSPSSSQKKLDDNDSLKGVFDLLYNIVKKLPPQLQSQVKIDLFKIVTEAEMKLQLEKHS